MIPGVPGKTIPVKAAPDEREKVEDWRLKCLLDAGYPSELAEQIASDHLIDLHRACDMVEHKGCSPELAVRILT